jgi:hypothetical protein
VLPYPDTALAGWQNVTAAEIGQLAVVCEREEDVRGLEIQMQYALSVTVLQRSRDLPRVLPQTLRLQWTLVPIRVQDLLQISRTRVFVDKLRIVIVHSEGKNFHNILMSQTEGIQLCAEREVAGLGRVELFDRASFPRVTAEIDRAEAAASEFGGCPFLCRAATKRPADLA